MDTPTLIDTGTARIAHRVVGAGEPVLFIHGWPFHHGIWRKLVPELSQRYACHLIDLAGAGASEHRVGNDFSFHGHAAHLQRVARAVGLERYRIVAHDTGATVARRLAILEGDRVTQLALIDTELPHHRPPLIELFQRLFGLPGSNALFRRLLRSRTFVRSRMGFGGCVRDLSLLEGEFQELFITPLAESEARTAGQLLYARGIDWRQLDALREGHGELQGAVLLIWGDGDPFFPVALAREMIPQFKSCRGLEVVPGTRLLPHEEKPAEVLAHLHRFFEGAAN
jgi:pimeloyl-ACP methyl ester carboxylesterase